MKRKFGYLGDAALTGLGCLALAAIIFVVALLSR